MTLHSAGHRRVSCRAHSATVEAVATSCGRRQRHRGGDRDSCVHRRFIRTINHIGRDGFWLVREPSGRVRALMDAGQAGAKAAITASIVGTAMMRFLRAGPSPR